jgi:hypothetical protein
MAPALTPLLLILGMFPIVHKMPFVPRSTIMILGVVSLLAVAVM